MRYRPFLSSVYVLRYILKSDNFTAKEAPNFHARVSAHRRSRLNVHLLPIPTPPLEVAGSCLQPTNGPGLHLAVPRTRLARP